VASAKDIARHVWRRVADAADTLEKRRSALVFAEKPTSRPTVFFLTPDHAIPSGGIRVIYRHVDILNQHGIRASVVHRRPGFRCRWFENDTVVTNVAAVTIRPGDLLVVPEVDVEVLGKLPQGTRHVIFNQNSHLTWKRQSESVGSFYTADTGLLAVICVSDHNREMMRMAFPASPVRRIHLGIDRSVFYPTHDTRPHRIAYMPRRSRDDAEQVLAILRERGSLEGWEVVALDGLSHEEVADELRRARIFMAFTRQEGFGLPAAEAMACGCYVIGHHGFGGREFFLAQFSTRVETGNTIAFVSAVEQAIKAEAVDSDWCAEKGRRASRFVLQRYSRDHEREEVVGVYRELLGLPRPALVAFR